MFLHCLLFWNQAKWKHMRCGAIYSCSGSSLCLTMPVISAKPFHNTHNQQSSLPSFISPAWPQPGNSLHRTLIVFKQRASVSQERQSSKEMAEKPWGLIPSLQSGEGLEQTGWRKQEGWGVDSWHLPPLLDCMTAAWWKGEVTLSVLGLQWCIRTNTASLLAIMYLLVLIIPW